MIPVEVHADRRIPRRDVEEARRRAARLDRYVDIPLLGARLTLRRGKSRAAQPYVVDTSVWLRGRVLVAHAAGHTPSEAADLAASRLRRQLLRLAGAGVARRNEARAIGEPPAPTGDGHLAWARLKPPDARAIVRRRTYLDVPLPTLDALDELVTLGVLFLLFRHARTDEEVVVHRRDDLRFGLLFPTRSVLADEDDLVVPTPSRYERSLALAEVREQMDLVAHRFLYFGDAEDGRGKVLYLRRDGDYGLVEPA